MFASMICAGALAKDLTGACVSSGIAWKLSTGAGAGAAGVGEAGAAVTGAGTVVAGAVTAGLVAAGAQAASVVPSRTVAVIRARRDMRPSLPQRS
ncbi:hypothetical protein GCM10008956_16270 [Deinococcus arenae]|uniref:Uncharacterized protein n=1 Tax=Deinococcus arenae TaxID=1452751 RepID=A0A8H9GN79_9DEIO|nr:hypothetical protein GCM10008956_16270 [Deinococcus arenae]